MAYHDRALGPDECHPITGVQLNPRKVERKALNFEEAVTAHILRLQGKTFTQIVHYLGTNANRVGEVFRGEAHPDAGKEALRLMTQ
ncbi:hypothetical protein TG4357_02671 [Thalassovita gelatinovora]|uniref:Uncharacterized protein n=1 Tax=Thalassovita gelatinovora TaxID=53501 RepID=A0A0P1FFX4_THAGE|nr:hypothetical protein TG4357_02671 [Thalassovita gelatinovora]SEQ43694.1 hypothetical protein SAMN04488043_105208 [Thalassovita gelatinovora]